MSFLYAIYGLVNVLALTLIARYLYSRVLANDAYFFIHAAIISNMMLLVIYFNIVGDPDMKQYAAFVVVAFAGIYSTATMYKTLMIPTRKKGAILSDEEKLALPVQNKGRLQVIAVYFISGLLSALVLFIL